MSSTPADILFIRHAAISCNGEGVPLLCGSFDAPLTERGWRQVEQLRRRLASEPAPDAAFSSNLRRAVDTASALPPGWCGRCRVMRSFAEIDCGELDGERVDRVQREFPELWARNEAQNDEDFRWPGGETYRQFRRRVLRATRVLAARHPGGRVIVITHAGVVNQIVGWFHGQSAARWDNFRPGNTAITHVRWSGDSGQLVCFNDDEHLRSHP